MDRLDDFLFPLVVMLGGFAVTLWVVGVVALASRAFLFGGPSGI